MRWRSRVLVVLVLGSWCAPPLRATAQTDPLAALAGHWRCTVAHAHDAQRSYFLTAPGPERVLYGREDTTEDNGDPSFSLERIVRSADRTGTIEAVEGTGSTASADAAPLRFTRGTFALAYTVDGDTMRRVATDAGATLDDERCTRLPAAPVPSPCPSPNVPASTLNPVEPNYPAAAVASKASGIVHVIVVLDDNSRVVWTEVARSDNPVFNDEAVRSARLSTYRAAVRDCRTVAAKYLFTVDFSYSRR